VTERRPLRSGGPWQEVPAPSALLTLNPASASAWACGPIFVTSTLSNMERPGGSPGPTWLIAISRRGSRPRPTDVRKALRAFGMTAAEEDNHGPGNTRSFFLVVDAALRGICECKTDESVHRDPDGYTYSLGEDPTKCGGCDLAPITGRPCPSHGATA
jgi:hypothetical protein